MSFKWMDQVQDTVTAGICPAKVSLSKLLNPVQSPAWCLVAESDLWPPRGVKGEVFPTGVQSSDAKISSSQSSLLCHKDIKPQSSWIHKRKFSKLLTVVTIILLLPSLQMRRSHVELPAWSDKCQKTSPRAWCEAAFNFDLKMNSHWC